MSTLIPLVDGHTTGEGYLGSPKDGTLADVVRAVAILEQEHAVTPRRKLGVSLEYVLAARELGVTFGWGSPWVEEQPRGPRATIPAGQVDRTLLAGLAGLGLQTVCIGASCRSETVTRLLGLCADLGLETALAPSPASVVALDGWLRSESATGVVVESLAELVASRLIAEADATAAAPSATAALLLLAGLTAAEQDRATGWIQERGLAVTPLLTACWRRASLVNAVNAPALERAALALPYHQRLASLRAPGALRMGGKEASAHLNVPVLRAAEAKRVAEGYVRLRSILTHLINSRHPLLGGSGAPGVGLCSGHALREEFDLWTSLSEAPETIAAAFSTATPGATDERSGRLGVA